MTPADRVDGHCSSCGRVTDALPCPYCQGDHARGLCRWALWLQNTRARVATSWGS